ncbi:MAG: ubiquinol-cytochrome c reductase iron-sulfur subunit N-terminal domain-containing protein [Actinomycetota bacterium]|mgnify:CR=1 FL=1
MSDPSRRGFLILTGVGAAAVGAAAVAPAAFASGSQDAASSTAGDPLVAYVSNMNTGEVSVMMGEREVVIHDRALCASLARVLS